MADMKRKKQNDGLATILRGIQEVEAFDERIAELRKRQWKASELKRLKEHFSDSNAYGVEAIQAIHEEAKRAEAEGRVVDDLTPTVANVAAKLPEGSWVIPASQIGLMYQLARDVTRRPIDGTAWAMQRGSGLAEARSRWPSPTEAIQELMHRFAAEGRIATAERTGGLVFNGARPVWANVPADHGLLIHNEHLDPSDEPTGLVAAQRQRWRAIGENVLLAAERIRRADKSARSSMPLEELLGPQPRGARWERITTRDHLRSNLLDYDRSSRRALQSAEEGLSELNRTGVAELRGLVTSAADQALMAANK